MTTTIIYDANGARIEAGATLTGHHAGAIVTHVEPTDEGHHPRVWIRYPDGANDRWDTQPSGPAYAFYTCDELEVRP